MPSYGYSSYIACPTVQRELNDQFLYNPQTIQDPLGALKFVTSDYNTANTLQREVAPGAGKYRTVQLVYQPRFTDESSDSASINCDGGQEYGNTATTYEIDPTVGKSRSWKITNEDIATMCEADSSWFAKQIMAHIAAVERGMDSELATFIAANLGGFYGGGTSKTTTTKNADGQFVANVTADVVYEYQQLERMGAPLLLGNGLLNKYMHAMEAGCCALSGVDLGEFVRQNSMIFMRDKYVPTALGDADAFVAVAPGTIQMLQYRAFEAEKNQFNTEQLIQGVLVNPMSGIAYDYYAKYDCGVWNFQIKLAYKFVLPPEDQFNVNDPLYGTNGILKFQITNPT